jgi:hypothetical protein
MGSTFKRNERILQRLKLRDLRVLLAVAENGSMGKAAAELAMRSSRLHMVRLC